MKAKLPLLLALLIGLTLGALYSPWRYDIKVLADSPIVYRVDRLTGNVDQAAGSLTWRRIEYPSKTFDPFTAAPAK